MLKNYLAPLAKVAVLAALFVSGVITSGYSLDQKGMVLMIDESYRVEVLVSSDSGIAVGDGILWQNGNLFVADEGGSAFHLIEPGGAVKTIADESAGIVSPEDLVMDGAGNIFFTDDEMGGVWEIEHDGRVRRLAGKRDGLVSTEAIAVSPAGRLLVGDGENGRVFSVTQNGEVTPFLGPESGVRKPESMVFDGRGNLYIADNQIDVLFLVTPDGRVHRTIENTEGFSPETLWFADGRLFITDSSNGKLSVYTPEEGLQTIAVFGGALAAVNGVTTDDKGSIYLTVQSDLKHRKGFVLKLSQM